MLVKICGVTNRSDAAYAIGCGADFVGFVKDSFSKRYIADESLADVLSDAGVQDRSVAVYGPYSGEPFATRYLQCFLGGESGGDVTFGVVRPKSADEIDQVIEMSAGCQYLTLDAYSDSEHGGSGKRVDWSLAAEIVERSSVPVMLAGGLTCDNVQEAIRAVRPAGVDVSSGVERSPGVKDLDLVLRFVELAKSV